MREESTQRTNGNPPEVGQSISPLEEVIGDYRAFIQKGLLYLKRIGIVIQGMEIDHLAYRVADIDTYEVKRTELMNVSSAWVESVVHGRQIAKFVLQMPLEVEGFQVSLIELPAPKEGIHYKNGLEHFEVATRDRLDEIRARLNDLRDQCNLNIDTTAEPHSHNETLSVRFKEGLSVKFHRTTLLEVMQTEGQLLQTITK